MKREYLPLGSLSAWARFNGITTHDITFQKVESTTVTEFSGLDKGNAIVATADKTNDSSTAESEVLLQVPSDLILSLDAVLNHSKSDPDLRAVLEATDYFGKTTRGAIMIFLLVQITNKSRIVSRSVGLSSPWTEYTQFLPPSFPLPTSYSEAERGLLRGTSLADAVEAKLGSLEKEFDLLRSATENIPWCQQCWWDEEHGILTFDDWKYVDAAYRSRMLEIPNAGHAMVPCIDMVNHASESSVNALYDADLAGNVTLKLRHNRSLKTGDEITISYGDEKSASEMIFSYGFLDDSTQEAGQIVLDINFPDDDPLGTAKKIICQDKPGLKVSTPRISNSSNEGSSEANSRTSWESPLIWWSSVNEEDGLHIGVVQTIDGQKELEATWKGEKIQDSSHLHRLIAEDSMADIFRLRALVLVLQRLEEQISLLHETEQILSNMQGDQALLDSLFNPDTFDLASRLRVLETKTLQDVIEDLIHQRDETMQSETVVAYLAGHEDEPQTP